MIIKKIAMGNANESFIEDSIQPGFNIISSDDNNKGKTITIQSMMYTLGNEPTFPSSFLYKEYYHVVEFEENGVTYYLCRYNAGFIMKYEDVLMIFDSVSELKRYWTKHIFELPQIVKNERLKIVDPVLFLQLFFTGQDKKDTFNIANAGYYNKADFYNMLFAMNDLGQTSLNTEEIAKAKLKIADLKDERSVLLKQYKILKSHKTTAGYLSTISDKIAFGEKLKQLEKVNNRITELRKSRNLIATRRVKWESTIKELRSLNRTLDCGELRCMECNSSNISFSMAKKHSYTFDISTIEMRNDIIASIQEKLSAYNEEIEKYAINISHEQACLQELMSDDMISLEAIVAYKNEIFSACDAELRIEVIDNELEILKNDLHASEDVSRGQKGKQRSFLSAIVELMNDTYKEIDPTGNLLFCDLFTKRDEVFSGSEATLFHLLKIYSMAVTMKHNYPIVIDSFRAEDLSTKKEKMVIEIYSRLATQKIFTTTLKSEELGKYDNYIGIHHLNYKTHEASKMLSSKYNKQFQKLLANMSIKLST